MSRYLTEEEVNNLEKMGLSENEIKKIKEILKWYHKKGSNLDVEINGEAILKLSNLKDLLKEPEVYGVSGSGSLRELVLRKLDSENRYLLYGIIIIAVLLIISSLINYL
ncbi:MAG: hypothetical protein ACRDDY_10870 [Clostridium sp.]|uniref:hypothetical protein n=1 Tax=Clostridium sp. TaxID=1506 RepID=UPI003EE58DFF